MAIAVCAWLPIFCVLPIKEPWADEGCVYRVQKLDWIRAATGHEAGPNTTLPLTHFLLLMQVGGRLNEGFIFYIFMVPVPPQSSSMDLKCHAVCCFTRHRLILLCIYTFYFLLFFLCGDIELNLGLSMTEALNKIWNNQKHIKAKLQAIEMSQNRRNTAIQEQKSRRDSTESTIT